MTEENLQEGAPKRMSLKKKTSGTMTLQSSGSSKQVQVEVRKKKVIVDRKEREAQLEQEAIAKAKAEEEQKALEAKKKAVDMITKAQQTTKNIQKTASASLTKMLTETEAFYTKNLQEIKSVKNRLSAQK